jgi:putative transposase
LGVNVNDPQVYLHFVWATKHREPVIPAECERDLYRVMEAEARQEGCQVMAINGMPDHVHLFVRFSRTCTMGRLMNQVKGVSSSFLNGRLYGDGDQKFRWQPGYGVYSVSPNHVRTIITYVLKQKEHHANQTTQDGWEDTGNAD